MQPQRSHIKKKKQWNVVAWCVLLFLIVGAVVESWTGSGIFVAAAIAFLAGEVIVRLYQLLVIFTKRKRRKYD